MHNLECVPENETHNLLWDFENKEDLLIPARRPDRLMIKKEYLSNIRVWHPRAPLSKNESKTRDKYFGLYRELKKSLEPESDGDT